MRGRLAFGMAVAVCALAVVIASAGRTPAAEALPACPTATPQQGDTVAHAAVSVDRPADSTAAAFVQAWWSGESSLAQTLSDPIFRRQAGAMARSALRMNTGDASAGVHVAGLGAGRLATDVRQACGEGALRAMRTAVTMSPGGRSVRLFLVLRPTGYVVWAVR